MCKIFIHLNNFVYQNKRIYIELDDNLKVYSVKMIRSNSISMKIPLRSWTRLRIAPIYSKIIHQVLQIREKNAMKTIREREETNDIEKGNLTNRMARMEKSLKSIEATLKSLSAKMNQKNF